MARRPWLRNSALTVVLWRGASLICRAMPVRVIPVITSAVGAVAAWRARNGFAMAARHQRRINPDASQALLDATTRQVFARYVQYWIESLRLPYLSAARVRDGITVEGYEHVQAGLDAGSGVILALPHLGGWEWAGRWLAERGVEVVAVAERLEPPELFTWMCKLRKSLGITVVPLDQDAGASVLAALRRNAVVCLLCDRDIQGGGVAVEFFGETTTIPAGPAALARRSGAVLLPTAVLHTDRMEGHRGVVLPPIRTRRDGCSLRAEVQVVSQELAEQLEVLIRQAPAQWHLLQPNWPTDS